MNKDMDRYQGCLLGLAVADAVGTTVEFLPRGSFKPVTDMTGGGPFNLEPGQWTDDTSLALCLATSLVEKQGFDALDQMQRYVRWKNEGYLSSNGRCFDIGNTTRIALNQFCMSGDPFSGPVDKNSAGNGSLMRLAPVPMYYAPDLEKAMNYSAESSRTTHGAPEAVEACRLYGGMLVKALEGSSKEEILFGFDPGLFNLPKISALAGAEYIHKKIEQISGSGYVINSLEAALWCFWSTNSYAEAVLASVNLGEDTDTTAAVCGQVAGAFYGRHGIPQQWLEKLTMGKEITWLADQLAG
jgi:ADP-ribosyl-[dinitrogen reductase] hydrolase